jgi:hypothetical protein
MLDDNGWVSVDLFVASIIVIIAVTSLTAIAGDRMLTTNSIQEISEAKILAENIATTIDSVYSNGEGYETLYKMPSNISGNPYIIVVNASGLFISFNHKMGYAHTTPMDISYGSAYGRTQFILKPDKKYKIVNIIDHNHKTHIIVTEV